MTPTPSIGDMWEYGNPEHVQNIVVLIKQVPCDFFANTIVYRGFDILNNAYGEYYFNSGNMSYWRKLA